MIEKLLTGPHMRFMADAMLGLLVFCALTVALLGPSSAACLLPVVLAQPAHVLSGAQSLAGGIPLATVPSVMIPGSMGDFPSFLALLAVVFSMLFALNLTFVRHIASAYRVVRRPARASPPSPNRVT